MQYRSNMVLCMSMQNPVRHVYTECQRQCRDVAGDIARIKWFRLLPNQASCSKNGVQPQLIRCDTSIDADSPNQSLTLSVNEP